MRYISLFIFLLVATYLFLNGKNLKRNSEKPMFLLVDQIARDHETNIDITCLAQICPDSLMLEKLMEDYSNLWAHMNHAYATGNPIPGKEYYTERWFNQLAKQYDTPGKLPMSRKDISHNLQILNWSEDNLLCTVTDQNVFLEYTMPDMSIKTSRMNLVMVLLFQGDHWRIDAIRTLDETFE